jgi:hypothetical protein
MSLSLENSENAKAFENIKLFVNKLVQTIGKIHHSLILNFKLISRVIRTSKTIVSLSLCKHIAVFLLYNLMKLSFLPLRNKEKLCSLILNLS